MSISSIADERFKRLLAKVPPQQMCAIEREVARYRQQLLEIAVSRLEERERLKVRP